MIRRLAPGLLLIPMLAACSHADKQVLPPPPSATATLPTPVAGRFTGLVKPCPTVHDRVGVQTASVDVYINSHVSCTYGGRPKYPVFYSTTTINKPFASQGSPDSVASESFLRWKSSVQGNTTTVEDRAGFGDESALLISYPGNHTTLTIRSANVLIQVSGEVDADPDRAREIAALKALEPQVTELAKALLGQLK